MGLGGTTLSFFIFQQRCKDCGKEWNASFGIVGTAQIGTGAAKVCPYCESANIEQVSQNVDVEEVPMQAKEPYLFCGKFTGKEVDAMTQDEKDYLILLSIDLEYGGLLGTLFNRHGAPNATVCPRCHVDDFTHVEGCEFILPEPDEEV